MRAVFPETSRVAPSKAPPENRKYTGTEHSNFGKAFRNAASSEGRSAASLPESARMRVSILGTSFSAAVTSRAVVASRLTIHRS